MITSQWAFLILKLYLVVFLSWINTYLLKVILKKCSTEELLENNLLPIRRGKSRTRNM